MDFLNPPESFEVWYPKLFQPHHVSQADYLINLKQMNQTDVWVVIDAIIDLWRRTHQSEWKAFIVEVEQDRDTRADKFGASKNKQIGLRYTVDCPDWVCKAIRYLYDPDELPLDKTFWREFWHRYPRFRVSERS